MHRFLKLINSWFVCYSFFFRSKLKSRYELSFDGRFVKKPHSTQLEVWAVEDGAIMFYFEAMFAYEQSMQKNFCFPYYHILYFAIFHTNCHILRDSQQKQPLSPKNSASVDFVNKWFFSSYHKHPANMYLLSALWRRVHVSLMRHLRFWKRWC